MAKAVMLKYLRPGYEFKRPGGEHRYVVSSQREESYGNVKVFCYNLTNGSAYFWSGSKLVEPLREKAVPGHDEESGRTTDTRFEEVSRLPGCLEKGKKYQIEIQGNDVVICKETEWIDVTKSCHLVFRQSRHSNGGYVAVMYGAKDNVTAAIIGVLGIKAYHNFKIVKATGAWTSFNVLMRNK